MNPPATRASLRTLAVAVVLAGSASAQLTWTQQQPANAPAPRHGHDMALSLPFFEPFLFGGTDGTTSFGDTWSWNGQDWSLRATTGPSPRSGHALQRHDFHDNSLLLFGGRDGAGALSDETWIWNGAAWSQLATATAPSPRTGHALASDEMALVKLVLFGGRTATGLSNETWVFEGGQWSLLATAHQPPAREGHALIWSAITGGMLLQGGRDGATVLDDEWRFDGVDWHPVAVSQAVPRADHALCFENIFRYRYLAFGGLAGSASADTSERTVQDRWLHHQTVGAPTARTGTALESIFHQTHARYLLFGGRGANGAALGDTWLMEPALLPSAVEFGAGCGPGPWAPTGPVISPGPFQSLLGAQMQGYVINPTPNPMVLLLVGPEHPQPPFGGCGILVLRKRTRVLPMSGGVAGFHTYDFALDIPFEVNLRGTTLCLQAIARDQATGALAFSKALRLTLAD